LDGAFDEGGSSRANLLDPPGVCGDSTTAFSKPGYGLPVYRTTQSEIPFLFFSGARCNLELLDGVVAPLKNKKKNGGVSLSINRQLLT
jgi:hypothetical protein